ncbi:MAG: DUF4300 family protein [Bacillota bacterium]|nr:DUF4300 family protein [Bacillota bacterium]
MKKVIASLLLLSLLLVSCQQRDLKGTEMSTTDTAGNAEVNGGTAILMSNLADEKSKAEVKAVLSKVLNPESVERFMENVADYNDTIENRSLNEGFVLAVQPEYDIEGINELWISKKENFAGTNCRINTFMLLNKNLKIDVETSDDSFLFADKDAILEKSLFDEAEMEEFKKLFSKVKTENTVDVRVHGNKMEEHLSGVTFPEKVKMVSVVLHDNLDGDFLFIGHTGVLVEDGGKYLFLEKLTFDEPYQAIFFDSAHACHVYLFEKYKHYHDETTAKPFIMENGTFIDLPAYYK